MVFTGDNTAAGPSGAGDDRRFHVGLPGLAGAGFSGNWLWRGNGVGMSTMVSASVFALAINAAKIGNNAGMAIQGAFSTGLFAGNR